MNKKHFYKHIAAITLLITVMVTVALLNVGVYNVIMSWFGGWYLGTSLKKYMNKNWPLTNTPTVDKGFISGL